MSKAKSVAYYTCFFGPTGNVADKIPECPSKVSDCYYYTNNKDTLERVKATGTWKTVFIDTPIKSTERDNAQDSKELKACPHRFKELAAYPFTMYFDSKRQLSEAAVHRGIDTLKNSNDLVMLVKKHPFIEDSVSKEFEVAMGQPRYAEDRDAYKNYMDTMLKTNPALKDSCGRHFETCMILRKMGDKAKEIGERWYTDIQKTGPECQISFSFIQQMYSKQIDFFESEL